MKTATNRPACKPAAQKSDVKWLALATAGTATLAGNTDAAIVQITQSNIHAGGNYVSASTDNFSAVLADDGKIWQRPLGAQFVGSRVFANDAALMNAATGVGVDGLGAAITSGFFPLLARAQLFQTAGTFTRPTPSGGGGLTPGIFTGQVKFSGATSGNDTLQGPALSATRLFRVGAVEGLEGDFKWQRFGLMEVLATYDGTAEGNRLTVTRLIFDDADPTGASLPTYLTAEASYPEAGATSSVPEPSSLALLALGAGGLLLRRRRKAA